MKRVEVPVAILKKIGNGRLTGLVMETTSAVFLSSR